MIRTIEDARATGYGSPAFKTQYREGFCIESVMKGYHLKQCTRKIWKDGFCKQHHPETVKAKNDKRERRWKFKMENNPFTVLAGERDSYKAKAEGLMGLINDLTCHQALTGNDNCLPTDKYLCEVCQAQLEAKQIMEGK